jgi:hypothetical protein
MDTSLQRFGIEGKQLVIATPTIYLLRIFLREMLRFTSRGFWDMADNTGYFYPNEGAKGKQPNMTGKLTMDGLSLSIAGWWRVDKKGNKYLSLKINPVYNSTVDSFPPMASEPEDIF